MLLETVFLSRQDEAGNAHINQRIREENLEELMDLSTAQLEELSDPEPH